VRFLWSRCSLLVGALLLAATGAFAWMSFIGSRPSGNAAPAAPSPLPAQDGELAFAETDVDLGLIKEPTTHEIPFENRSDHVVTIRKIRTSCGCAPVHSDTQLLNPGDKGRITVTATPRLDRIGAAVYGATVEYDGAQPREARLRIRVQSRPDVVVANEVELRAVAGRQNTAAFTLVDYRDEPLKIESIAASSPDVQARVVEEPSSYLPGWQYRVEAAYSPYGRLPGDYAETITLHTSDPDRESIPVRLAIHHVSRIRVAPAALHLAAAPDPSEAVGVFYLDDAEGEAVEVRDLTASDALLHCRLLSDPPPQGVEVWVRKAELDRLAKGASVRVTLAKPTSEVLCVPIAP
jgi:hypothetical protein